MQDFASQNSLHDVDLSFDALFLFFFFPLATQQRFVPRSGGGAASGKTNMEKAVKSLQIICRSSLVGDFPPAVCWQAHAEIHLDGWCVCLDRGMCWLPPRKMWSMKSLGLGGSAGCYLWGQQRTIGRKHQISVTRVPFVSLERKKVKCFGANDDVVKKPTEFIDRKWVTSDGTTRENLQLIDLSVLYLTHIVHDKVHDK